MECVVTREFHSDAVDPESENITIVVHPAEKEHSIESYGENVGMAGKIQTWSIAYFLFRITHTRDYPYTEGYQQPLWVRYIIALYCTP